MLADWPTNKSTFIGPFPPEDRGLEIRIISLSNIFFKLQQNTLDIFYFWPKSFTVEISYFLC